MGVTATRMTLRYPDGTTSVIADPRMGAYEMIPAMGSVPPTP
jgi:hypothetical protein